MAPQAKSLGCGVPEGDSQSKPVDAYFFTAPVAQREPINQGIPLHFDPFELVRNMKEHKTIARNADFVNSL